LVGLLGEKAHKRSLISPAQAEKVVPKAQRSALNEIIVKPTGKPMMAPENDKRPAINVTDGDFEDVSVDT